MVTANKFGKDVLVGQKKKLKIFPVSMVKEGFEQVVSGGIFLTFFIIVLFTILHLLIIKYYKICYLHVLFMFFCLATVTREHRYRC